MSTIEQYPFDPAGETIVVMDSGAASLLYPYAVPDAP